MSRHFYIISLAMLLMTFSTGQSTGYGCLDNCIRDEIQGIFDGDGCLADCLGGGCMDCGDCADCDACNDCGESCGCDGCLIDKVPGTYGTRPAANNAVQVRLTASAFSFLESMVAPMLGDIIDPMARSLISGSERNIEFLVGAVGTGSDKQLCASNRVTSCGAEIDIQSVKLVPQLNSSGPDRLSLRLEVAIRLVSYNGNTRYVGWLSRQRTRVFGIGGSWNNCTLTYDTRADANQSGRRDSIDVEITFGLGTSGVAPRADINIINMLPMSGGTGSIEGVHIAGELDGCGLGGLVNNDIAGFVVHVVKQELEARIPQLVRTVLCEDPRALVDDNGNQPLNVGGQPGACPTGTSLRNYSYGMDGILPPAPGCGANNTSCLPMLIGLEGRLDASALLNSLAPGFTAVVDFIVAAANGATTPNGGLSIWLKGGLASTSGHSHCVPALDPDEIPAAGDVPRAAVFQGNSHPNVAGSEPEVMVGVSEQFVNRAAYELWSSGALCLQIGSSTLPMLDPGLVGILFGADLGNLVFPAADSDSPLGVGLRPQKPPTIRFDNAEGGGVKVGVSLPQVQLDFYAWGLDRYIRFVTFELDIDVGVAVTANNGAIALDLLGLEIGNTRALNDSLISNGSTAATLISNVVGGLIPSFLGGDGPLFELDLGSMLPETLELGDMEIPMPLSIELRDGALTAVYTDAGGATIQARDDENGHAFLGVFVDFGAPSGGGSGLTAAIDTQVEISSVYLPEDKSAFAPESFGEGELPRVEFVMSASAPAGVPVEYRYRLGLGGWSDWQDSPYGVIESPLLLLQQEHKVFARARVKGERRTEDLSSAIAGFTTDVTAPLVDLTAESKGIRLQAFDFHTRAANLEYRYREPEGEFSDWAKLGESATALIDGSRDVEVEVRDAAGNIASNVAELRGLPPSSAAAGGCSCSAAGPISGSSSSMLGFFAMVGMIGGMMYRLRRREEKV